MYDDKFITKEKKIWTKDKIELQHKSDTLCKVISTKLNFNA